MAKPIVFVDTNAVDNRGSATTFLGGRGDLEKIAKRADIALPRVVYDELCKHINGFLRGQRDSFKTNPHRHLLKIEDADIDEIDHASLVGKLATDETIAYEIMDLADELSAYREAYKHALEGSAPFEASGDKGFKDTLIAKTIDQFMRAHPDRKVFLWTSDGRLGDYFRDTNVQIIKGFQDFDREYSDDKMEEDSLMDRIWDYFDEEGVILSPERRDPDDQWLNSEGDIVSLFQDADHGDVYLLVDATMREPVSYVVESIAEAIEDLEGVGSFQTAHDAIGEVDYVFAYCGMNHLKTVTQIMLTNDQIYGIGGDDDISQFAARLFGALDENGESKLAEELRDRYDLKLLTKEQRVRLPF